MVCERKEINNYTEKLFLFFTVLIFAPKLQKQQDRRAGTLEQVKTVAPKYMHTILKKMLGSLKNILGKAGKKY